MKNKRYKEHTIDKEKVKKLILYLLVLAVSLTVLILEFIFFFLPDGVIGFAVCMICIYLTVSSVIKICRLTADPVGTLGNILDLLFWLP